MTVFYRYVSLANVVPHCVSKDGLKLEGYNIPRNVQVIPNLYAVHFDPEIFPDPYTFNVDHFLNKDGKVINTDKCVTFGIGKYGVKPFYHSINMLNI